MPVAGEMRIKNPSNGIIEMWDGEVWVEIGPSFLERLATIEKLVKEIHKYTVGKKTEHSLGH